MTEGVGWLVGWLVAVRTAAKTGSSGEQSEQDATRKLFPSSAPSPFRKGSRFQTTYNRLRWARGDGRADGRTARRSDGRPQRNVSNEFLRRTQTNPNVSNARSISCLETSIPLLSSPTELLREVSVLRRDQDHPLFTPLHPSESFSGTTAPVLFSREFGVREFGESGLMTGMHLCFELSPPIDEGPSKP